MKLTAVLFAPAPSFGTLLKSKGMKPTDYGNPSGLCFGTLLKSKGMKQSNR